MASTLVLLVHLLLVSVASASHYTGGAMTFTYKGRNPDGTFKVNFRNKATFDGYYDSHNWYCYYGNCGYNIRSETGVTDRSSNSQWCESETVSTRNIESDQPFQLREASCCWRSAQNWLSNWRLLTLVDLGTRSDTRQPNKSPNTAILPFLRVPQNCPRTYKLMSFDPDGDKVRCRYGNIVDTECSACSQPPGFYLDQDSCTLYYHYTNADNRVHGFELVVEDFPHRDITLTYSDGSQSPRAPLMARRKRQASTFSYQTTSSSSSLQTTTASTPPNWSMWQPITTTPPTTTTPHHGHSATTDSWWSWWYGATSTVKPTTSTIPWQEWWYSTTAEPTTTDPWWSRWWYGATTTEEQITAAATTTMPPYTTEMRHLHAITSPLSKLPLQFSLLVDPSAPSCEEGDYIPKLVHPTPENGAQILAEVNKEVEIRVKAQAMYTTINDIIISGPLNISKHRTIHEEFIIRWTPVPDDLGDYFPICFAVESVTGSAVTSVHTTQSYHYHITPAAQSSIYQSEMRCVLVDVRREQVKTNVICTGSTMTVVVEKSSLSGLSEDHLQLNDLTNTACSLQEHSNITHVIAVIPLNACGTQIYEDDENLIFKNEITAVDESQGLISRGYSMEVQFYCQYPKRGITKLGFTAHRENVTVWERGFGTFTYQFEFYPDENFHIRIDPNSYPLEYDIGSRMFMQIEVTSSVNNTELFVESCRASPYDNPDYKPTYPIIENGCEVDQTVIIHSPAHGELFQFSMEAFKFIGLHDHVYISCSVLMCEAGSPNTRCSRGCITSTQPGTHHQKREAVIQSANHFVSQGPLHLRSSTGNMRGTVIGLNLNVVFIAGCLLAAVGMICLVVMHRAKMSKVKYQPLPVFES